MYLGKALEADRALAGLGKANALGDKEAVWAETLERMEWLTQQGARGIGDDGHQSVSDIRHQASFTPAEVHSAPTLQQGTEDSTMTQEDSLEGQTQAHSCAQGQLISQSR